MMIFDDHMQKNTLMMFITRGTAPLIGAEL
jgi:hypothetical protein